MLYIDDETLLARLGREMPESRGYEVLPTSSRVEALAFFGVQPKRFDLAITDQMMPTLMGENLARELRRIWSDIPIILCTGYNHVMDAEKAKSMGIDAVCMKPLDIGELARMMGPGLGHHGDVEHVVAPSDM